MERKKITECYRCGCRHEVYGEYYVANATAWKTFCRACAYIFVCHLCGYELETRKQWARHMDEIHRRRLP